MMRSEMIRGWLLLCLCWSLFGMAACKRHASAESAPFPASGEVSDWARTGNIRTFQAADLWKYIDGEAERYVKAGVQHASTADYRFRDKLDAVVDIYRMATTAGAESLFASEPAMDAQFAALGDGARVYSQSLVFRKGFYLVRITGYEDSAEMKPALLALARHIEQRLTK